MTYESVIGLEVHAQMLTKSKLFCSCSTTFQADPNDHACPICMGMPGVLPVLNEQVIEFAIRTGLAMQGTIADTCRFARKNYFYPDLPKGFQTSQYDEPLVQGGGLTIDVDGESRFIRLTRIHMEEDAGKSIHGENLADPTKSYVDHNRCGVPLLEIVSEPDLRSAEEAKVYLQKLKTILEYIEVCDGNMEEGSLRCDANVSLRPVGTETLGTRTEIKNLNSFRNVQHAIEYEIERQAAILDSGGEIEQETRLYDADRGVTQSMRSKEEAHDYRYFPEPDLVPMRVDQPWVDRVRAELPELPDAKRERYITAYGLPDYDAEVLTADRELAAYFECTVDLFNQPKVVSNWVMGDLMRELNRHHITPDQAPVTPAHLAGMLQLVDEGTISGKIAKTVFDEMYQSGKQARDVVEEKGLVQMNDSSELESLIRQVLEANPSQVEEYRGGKQKVFGFFVGQTMKATQGKANPKMVNDLLRQMLEA
ncbi:MAG: aspartyl/glutamyl-tRNA amidotransferase subunit B [Candidatus Entotheonella factor]|uniref:Aspartyl/glutamyl-tRNA(Asn/Gln) amidotransferase subunit B n=1 Tax=Entotheonella factor TaxID=1429438 RepID=W4LKQ5_ENTF1|nr:MAG: aspartyl/glutamyl-tRNA amidotransferase subunit B [Candidatus Entotheonella factor]